MTQHTKDFLAQELRKIGLEEMAKKAETGYYHDFLSPLDLPELQLDADLLEAMFVAGSMNNKTLESAVGELRKRHHNGEFDASIEESDEWAQSPEGQDALNSLAEKKS